MGPWSGVIVFQSVCEWENECVRGEDAHFLINVPYQISRGAWVQQSAVGIVGKTGTGVQRHVWQPSISFFPPVSVSPSLSSIILFFSICHAQLLISSVSAGNLIKMTSRFLPRSPYTYNCLSLSLCCSHLHSVQIFTLSLKKYSRFTLMSGHSLLLSGSSLRLSPPLFKPGWVSRLPAHGSQLPGVAFPGFICLRVSNLGTGTTSVHHALVNHPRRGGKRSRSRCGVEEEDWRWWHD